MSESAIPISQSSFFKAMSDIKEVKPEPEVVESTEGLIRTLRNTTMWSALRERIESQIHALRCLQGMIDPSLTVEAVGFRFLACSLAIEHLQTVIAYVEGVGGIDEKEF